MTYDEFADALARKSRIARYIQRTAFKPAANDVDPAELLRRIEPLINAIERKSAELRALSEQLAVEMRRR